MPCPRSKIFAPILAAFMLAAGCRTSSHDAVGVGHHVGFSAPLGHMSPSPFRTPIPDTGVNLAAAARYAVTRDVRVSITVVDLAVPTHAWHAGSAGMFGTGSVVKVLVAAKMLLSGAMDGQDAAQAYEMIIGSNDDICNELWERFGGPAIIGWLSDHYGIAIGSPNLRPGFWGNTQITSRGLAALYVAMANDPRVWPWLHNAMAHTKRIADDGTDQYFGIPDAGGGHTVKQGWGSASAGNGYSPDECLNTTGFVESGAHTYAVVILSEGDANNSSDDARGFNATQATVLTDVAAMVLRALGSAALG